LWLLPPAVGQSGGELRIAIHSEPKTFHPALVAEEASETVRYLTGGVLIRVNRQSQKFEPELATQWKIAPDGRSITFTLRTGVSFSDGTPFTAEDVAYTFRVLMDPQLQSPTADSFRSDAGPVQVSVKNTNTAVIMFPAPLGDMERLFDQVAMMSSRSPQKELATLGPFMISEHKPGAFLLLRRNPHYWKKDAQGRQLPYLDAIRLEIQSNRDAELLRFQRGQLDLMNSLEPDHFDRLKTEGKINAVDLGTSLDSEFLWFNQALQSPIPDYRKAWFTSPRFRNAVSRAINRQDLAKIVYRGHATPAFGPVSPANRFWYNSKLKPHEYDFKAAVEILKQDGFRLADGVLRDRSGNAVEFSVVTNSGNRSRERMAAMIQADLQKIGIKLNIVTLDFPSLVERIGHSLEYEACLLSFVNVDLDPNGQMNVWLSSAPQHAWNPSQKSPATPWEERLDKLMRAQSAETNIHKRKAYFDQVQQIVWEQEPLIYLLHKNVLVAVSDQVKNAAPSVLRPQTFWNAPFLSLQPEAVQTAK
jgi:peptide/nickel transport system substrate-binding protein